MFIQLFDGEKRPAGYKRRLENSEQRGEEEIGFEMGGGVKRDFWLSGYGSEKPDLKYQTVSGGQRLAGSTNRSTRAETPDNFVRNQAGISSKESIDRRDLNIKTGGKVKMRAKNSRLERSKYSSASNEQLAIDGEPIKPCPDKKIIPKHIFHQDRRSLRKKDAQRITSAYSQEMQQQNFKNFAKNSRNSGFDFDKSWSRNNMDDTSGSAFGKSQNFICQSRNDLLENETHLINVLP